MTATSSSPELNTDTRATILKVYERRKRRRDVSDEGVSISVYERRKRRKQVSIRVYERKRRKGNNVMELAQSRLPKTPAKKPPPPQRQRSTRGIPMLSYSTSYLLEDDNNTENQIAEHLSTMDENNDVDCGGDFAKEDEQVLAFDLPSSQLSSNAETRSRGFSNIHASFMPVPAHTTKSISQYNLKNQELVDGGKHFIVDTKHVGTSKSLHAAMLERSQKKLKRKVYRPKVVRNLGRPIPRMEPKTPTKKNRNLKLNTRKIMKKNVSVKNFSSTVALNETIVSEREFLSIDVEKHSEDETIFEKTVDTGLCFLRKKKRTTIRKKWEVKDYSKLLEPDLGRIKEEKRMGRRRREVRMWQNIASELQENYPKRRSNRNRELNILKAKKELSSCFIGGKEALCIEESLTDLISSLESDDFRFIKSTCMYGELGVVAITKKKGRRQKKLEELKHGELAHPWNLQLQNEVEEGNKHDKYNSEFWDGEREFFRGRIDLFLYRMRIVQGNRTFSEWNGSVMDSIIGVFLTQNVSDHSSSSAFISLAAAFPIQPSCNQELTYANPRPSFEQSRIFKIEELVESANSKSSSKAYCDEISSGSHGSVETIMGSDDRSFVQEATTTLEYHNQKLGDGEIVLSSQCEVACCGESTQVNGFEGENYYVNMPSDQSNWWMNIITENSQSDFNEEKRRGKKSKVAGETNNEGILVNGRPNWDFFKRLYEKGEKIRPMDSVNWQAVRQADVDEVAEAIKVRGQQNNLAGRIKKFLDEVHQDHSEINLEWLRGCSDKLVRRYLTNIDGFGLKSVECVRLLALKQIAFPVDVNVGRIAIRLGWVPMQPLPEDVQIHLLDEVPVMDNIQKYLWPRLMKLTFKKLYELHYQMITFGKVYCTKRQPNCQSCPMKNECKYYLSAYTSVKYGTLPKLMKKQVDPSSQSNCEHATKFEYQLEDCEPVIEEPTSSRSSSQQLQYVERDIEDLFRDNPFKEAVNKSLYRNAQEESDKSFLTLEEAAFIPARRLKEVKRLMTKHSVYEINDGCPLFKELQLERRHPHDKSPYLFAMYTSDEMNKVSQAPQDIHGCKGCKNISCNVDDTCFSCKSLSLQTDIVQGTLLIPCRTAMRGSFPLNGTYFQINEVFMDHESSINPITVHRELLWNLETKNVYCGTSTSTILEGLSTYEVFECFDKGFICVRAFNRETRKPERLIERFHIPTIKATKKRKKRIPKEQDWTI